MLDVSGSHLFLSSGLVQMSPSGEIVPFIPRIPESPSLPLPFSTYVVTSEDIPPLTVLCFFAIFLLT